ncbi:MAG TPA: hypothetical protein VGX71_25500 [Pseudaminobacter sp.]|nr:hypothetical protein [Pseudaminobacter sp.]
MKKRTSPTAPEWPPESLELERAIGKFVISWAILELQIDLFIEDLVRGDDLIGRAVAAHLAAKAKLDLAQGLMHVRNDVLGEGLVLRADKLVARTNKAAGDSRNFIAHGKPMPVDMEGFGGEVVWFWTQFRARKGGMLGSGIKLGPGALEEINETTKLLVNDWHQLRCDIQKGLELADLIARG